MVPIIIVIELITMPPDIQEPGHSDRMIDLRRKVKAEELIDVRHDLRMVVMGRGHPGIEITGQHKRIIVAPKGSGTSVRRNFLSGAGINSSYAFEPNGMKAKTVEEVTKAIGIGVGSGYLFPTTFQNEVTSDLVGERGILMGALAGVMEAQFETLRANGHSPSEAFNETCEELTQSLIRLVDENGMDWMYGNCSQTAQHGALKWRPEFKKATLPVFKKLYKSVKTMQEAKEVIRDTGCSDYKEKMLEKLNELHNHEMWLAGAAVRSLRPNEKAKGNAASAGWGGRKVVK
jgi:ketol-acid reductoisomerase